MSRDTLDTDILIIGAGVAGSAVAMHCAEHSTRAVTVIDPDCAGELSSSERNAGGVRATWWQRENVLLCRRTIERLRAAGARVGFRPHGYTWLYHERQWLGAVAALDMQNECGCEIEILSPRALGARHPWMHVTPTVAGATWSPHDGLVNANLVREWYRERARAAGATFLDRRAVVGSIRDPGHAPVVLVTDVNDDAAAHTLLSEGVRGVSASGRIRARVVVNAAGPWAGAVATHLGYTSAAWPCAREVALVASDAPLAGKGMIVDTSGLYAHHESGNLTLVGWSPPEDAPLVSFQPEGRAFFERELWPRLAARIPAFERADWVRGWRGLYDLSPDRSAIAGAVAEGLYEIHSFSGRGIMQADALAELVAENILTGQCPAELEPFHGARFGRHPLPEALHI